MSKRAIVTEQDLSKTLDCLVQWQDRATKAEARVLALEAALRSVVFHDPTLRDREAARRVLRGEE